MQNNGQPQSEEACASAEAAQARHDLPQLRLHGGHLEGGIQPQRPNHSQRHQDRGAANDPAGRPQLVPGSLRPGVADGRRSHAAAAPRLGEGPSRRHADRVRGRRAGRPGAAPAVHRPGPGVPGRDSERRSGGGRRPGRAAGRTARPGVRRRGAGGPGGSRSQGPPRPLADRGRTWPAGPCAQEGPSPCPRSSRSPNRRHRPARAPGCTAHPRGRRILRRCPAPRG
jgi:hypothetical protein